MTIIDSLCGIFDDHSSTTSKKARTSVGATPKSVAEVGSATKTKMSAKKAAPVAVSATAKKRKIADLENDVSGLLLRYVYAIEASFPLLLMSRDLFNVDNSDNCYVIFAGNWNESEFG